MLFDGPIDERGDVAGSSVGLVLSLGDGQLAEQLVEHLDRLGVFRGFGLAAGVSGFHNVDGGHDFGVRRNGGGGSLVFLEDVWSNLKKRSRGTRGKSRSDDESSGPGILGLDRTPRRCDRPHGRLSAFLKEAFYLARSAGLTGWSQDDLLELLKDSMRSIRKEKKDVREWRVERDRIV